MPTATEPSSSQSEAVGALAAAGEVEAYLESVLAERLLPANLRTAVRYALLGPGKRMRPILLIHACEAAGGTEAQAMPAAAAIEMIHAFSLVHDDLPAMDDDALRRGRPTLHRHTSEAMAILAGDLLNGLAFEVLATRLPADLSAPVAAELATATNDMIVGQVYDTVPDPDDARPAYQRLITIHQHKTASLFAAACRMGAICGRADRLQSDALGAYGEAVGLMFQVVDDVLDVTQSTEHLGKRSGKDSEQGKLTYPSVLGLDGSQDAIRKLQAEALDALEPLGRRGRPLATICRAMAARTR